MYSSVLLIGGGFMFNGAANMLQSRLQAKLPAPHRKLVDQVEVIARPKVRFVLFFFLFLFKTICHRESSRSESQRECVL